MGAVKGTQVTFWRTNIKAPLELNGVRTSNAISFDQTEFPLHHRYAYFAPSSRRVR